MFLNNLSYRKQKLKTMATQKTEYRFFKFFLITCLQQTHSTGKNPFLQKNSIQKWSNSLTMFDSMIKGTLGILAHRAKIKCYHTLKARGAVSRALSWQQSVRSGVGPFTTLTSEIYWTTLIVYFDLICFIYYSSISYNFRDLITRLAVSCKEKGVSFDYKIKYKRGGA